MTFLKDYFAKCPPGQFRFTGNDKPDTDLEITDQSAISKEVIEKRPAIILQRGPMSWAQATMDELKDLFFRDGTRRHSDLLTGVMTLHCIASEGLEAERLSWVVAFALKSHRRVLQSRGLFEVGRQAQIGSESPPGALVSGDTEAHTVDVPVFSPFYLQETWQITPAKKVPFKSMEIRLKPFHLRPRVRGAAERQIIELDGVAQTVKVPKV